MKKSIQSILIANRGEIAVRIIQTAKKLGIQTISVYSDQDKEALHVKLSDHAWNLGKGSLRDTYLNIEKIMQAAHQSNADAIHPGYGFLSENPAFAAACEQAGIIFIGPSSHAIQTMGNKLEATQFVKKLNVPVLEAKTGKPEDIAAQTRKEDLPVMIKAASGGGGKGMRIVYDIEKLEEVLQTTSREAENYFGDKTIYLEQYIENPKHIEIQVFGDHHGNYVHLFERECSIQRRHQKIIEEAPSPTLTEEQRQKMGMDAVNIAQAIDYSGAGTVEFLYDSTGNHYFLEMNTRIQVEHPVTEMITGVDIVKEQIRVAQNLPLAWSQGDLSIHGHAIEARIYAENPENNFLPSPGKMDLFSFPTMENLRTDYGVQSGDTISPDYDPMIAKIAGWGPDRLQAIDQLKKGLEQTHIVGIRHNKAYLLKVLEQPSMMENQFSTHFIAENHKELLNKLEIQKHKADKDLLAAAYIFIHSYDTVGLNPSSIWKNLGYWRNFMKWTIFFDDIRQTTQFQRHQNTLEILSEKTEHSYRLINMDANRIILDTPSGQKKMYYSRNGSKTQIHLGDSVYYAWGEDYTNIIQNKKKKEQINGSEKDIRSPMFGKVLTIHVNKDKVVKKGQTLLVLEAMKMENNILAPYDTMIKDITVAEGDQVEDGQVLLQIENYSHN